jgi:hypothetical protein
MTVAEQVTAEDDDADLTESLVALSTLSVARLSLEDLLTRVATFAVHAIPGADGAGLTLIEHDRSDTIVKSAAFVLVHGPDIGLHALQLADPVRTRRPGRPRPLRTALPGSPRRQRPPTSRLTAALVHRVDAP